MQDLFIEKIFYLSESLILILTRSLELRIIYTQKFCHGQYSLTDSKQDPSAQLDEGIFVNNLAQSEYG